MAQHRSPGRPKKLKPEAHALRFKKPPAHPGFLEATEVHAITDRLVELADRMSFRMMTLMVEGEDSRDFIRAHDEYKEFIERHRDAPRKPQAPTRDTPLKHTTPRKK